MSEETIGTTRPNLTDLELAQLQLAKTQQELVKVMAERDRLRGQLLQQQTEDTISRLSRICLDSRGISDSDNWRINLENGEFERPED